MYVPTDDLKNYKEQHPEAYKGIFPDSPSSKMNPVLEDISRLDNNWNHNGAKAFSKELLDKCQDLLRDFSVMPAIFPTAANSIQFEWNKNGDYLEFEIFEDKCTVFKMLKSGQSSEQEVDAEELKAILKDFL